MTTGEIIILIVYALGSLLTFFYQKNKIDSLKTQVNSQSGALDSMQKFMNIFQLDEVEKYVEMSKKKTLLEKQEEMKDLENRAKKDKQELEATLKSKAGQTVQMLTDDIIELLGVIRRISYNLIDFSNFEKAVEEMSDGFPRDNVIKILEKAKQEKETIGSINAGIMTMILQNPGLLQNSIAEGEKQKRADKEKD